MTGGVIGLTAGAVIGHEGDSELNDRAENAVLGTTVGAVVGVVLKEVVRQYDWPDVVASAAVGIAIGASAEGAGLGFAAGATTGFLLWRLHPSVGPAGVVGWALAGLAVGGLSDWVVDAVESGSEAGAIPLYLSVRW